MKTVEAEKDEKEEIIKTKTIIENQQATEKNKNYHTTLERCMELKLKSQP